MMVLSFYFFYFLVKSFELIKLILVVVENEIVTVYQVCVCNKAQVCVGNAVAPHEYQ